MNTTHYAKKFFSPFENSVPSEWCLKTLVFDEPGNRGPFTIAGREYILEPLNDWANSNIEDCACVFGSQTGKTTMLMAGAAWVAVNDPCGLLWVMPSIHLAQSFSETRWLPMLKRSRETSLLIPKGAQRHDFKKLQQQLGASIINFVGSNSAANLASRPARRVVLDEVDKFDMGGGSEADAVNLAEQRTKGQVFPQRWKVSTPSVFEGLIWQEFLKGDQRRYFLPCPSCQKHIVFAWSPSFSVLPKCGAESFVQWDKEARKPDGTWDLGRVEKSARIVCCFCGQSIHDGQKTAMVRAGEWRPTAPASAGFRSRHLSSLYASTPSTTFGKLAVKFLQSKQSVLGLQGFINGDLAEPMMSQDSSSERVEVVKRSVEVGSDVAQLITVDCQQKAPHFWAVKRTWKDGESQGLDYIKCDHWDELEAFQRSTKVPDAAVLIDSGFGAKSDAEVYRNCAEHCEMAVEPQIGMQFGVGWMPAKGMVGRKRWRDKETGLYVPYFRRPIDPYLGTANAGKCRLDLFEFAADYYKDLLHALRNGEGKMNWAVTEGLATEEYWRHMDGQIKTRVENRATGSVFWRWQLRHRHWPDHLFSCEVMQVAFAQFLGLFEPEVVNAN